MNILAEIDRQAKSDGALQQDAQAGRMLCTKLEAAWFEQGMNAAAMDLTPDEFWNEYQRAGRSAMLTTRQTLTGTKAAA